VSDRGTNNSPRLLRGWSELEKYIGVVSLGIGAAILVSYWQLLIVTAIGVGVMFLSYTWPNDRVQSYLENSQTWFEGANGKLAIAVASGSLAALVVVLALGICNGAGNIWLGIATVLQTLGTIAIAPLLLWQFVRKDRQHQASSYQRALSHLTATTDLDRLIAVNQIINQHQAGILTSQQQREVTEYLELMLDREVSPQVRSALLTGLNQLTVNAQSPISLPLPKPTSLAISLPAQIIAEEEISLKS
jgi:hypothetical protein